MKGLYIYDSESDGLLDEMTLFHVILLKEWHEDRFVLFLDPEREGYDKAVEFAKEKGSKNLQIYNIEYFPSWLKECERLKGLGCHNQFSHDLPAFKKLLNVDFSMFPDEQVGGRALTLLDTLSMSRCLYPDRPLPRRCPSKVKPKNGGKAKTIGPHGLEAWGVRVANLKVEIDDWQGLPLWKYVDRVWEDVIINELTYDALIREAKGDAISAKLGINWKVALRYNMWSDFLMSEQARHGVVFNKEKAEKLLVYIDNLMREIADRVEPQLPVKDKPASRQVTFIANPFNQDGTISKNAWKFAKNILGFDVDLDALEIDSPPAKPFKKDRSLSATGIKWCNKHGVTDESVMPDFIREQQHITNTAKPVPDDMYDEVRNALSSGILPEGINKEPMLISNQEDIKQWLYTEAGWEPTEWNTKDVTKDDRKQTVPENLVRVAVRDWAMNIKNSIYLKSIEKQIDVRIDVLLSNERKFNTFARKKGRALPTSPKLKDSQGNLCPNLAKINGDMAKDIVKWLSLRNRRAVIKALDEAKETGWLNNPRLAIDGRLPADYSGLTNTNRRKHRTCANVPKPSPDVLLGYEMRDLWTVPEGYLQLGCDASNLENMVAAWWAWVFGQDNGEYYHIVSQGDSHQNNADAYSKVAGREISRNDSKPITYGILYGCAAQKAADMLGVDKSTGQKAIDAFWDTNIGLKNAKEYLEKQWEASGKKYIRGIDGRKIYTRSKSSLLNAALQSTGAILMDRAGVNYKIKSIAERMEEKGIYRTIFYHDEYQLEIPRKYIRLKEYSTGFELPHDILSILKSSKKKDDPEGFIMDKCSFSRDQVQEVVGAVSECKKYMDGFEGGKFTLAGKPFVEGNKVCAAYSRAGELLIQSIEDASKSLNSPVIITGEYLIGNSWASAH